MKEGERITWMAPTCGIGKLPRSNAWGRGGFSQSRHEPREGGGEGRGEEPERKRKKGKGVKMGKGERKKGDGRE